jgi:predicted DNA binding protein
MSVQEVSSTGTGVEVDLTMPDPDSEFARLAAGLGCRLTYQPGLCRAADHRGQVFVSSGIEPVTLLAAAADRNDLGAPRLLTAYEGTAVIELESTTRTIVEVVGENGGRTDRLVVDPDQLEVTVVLPNGGAVRPLHDALATRFGQTTVAALREGVHPLSTRPGLLAAIDEALTGRQRTALLRAHSAGFFDWPREVSGEDLAASMDISPSTYHQHLRAAERKVLDALFET